MSILTCGGGAVSSTDGNTKGNTGGCTASGTNDGMLLWGNTSVNACTYQTKDLSCPPMNDNDGKKPEGNDMLP